MKKFHYLFHSIAYYIAWFSCITLAARGFAWLSPFIVIVCVLFQIYWQYKIQHDTQGLWYLLGGYRQYKRPIPPFSNISCSKY